MKPMWSQHVRSWYNLLTRPFSWIYDFISCLSLLLPLLNWGFTFCGRYWKSTFFQSPVDVVAVPAVMQCLFHPNKIKVHVVDLTRLLLLGTESFCYTGKNIFWEYSRVYHLTSLTDSSGGKLKPPCTLIFIRSFSAAIYLICLVRLDAIVACTPWWLDTSEYCCWTSSLVVFKMRSRDP